MHKSTFLFYGVGIAIGAGIGLAINNLAIGMGVGAALGLYLRAITGENVASCKRQSLHERL
jgi:hypothetical protein